MKALRWKHVDILEETESRPARLEGRRRVRQAKAGETDRSHITLHLVGQHEDFRF